jgi:hypothetical protein
MRIAVPMGWSRPKATAAHPNARKMTPDQKSFDRPIFFPYAILLQPSGGTGIFSCFDSLLPYSLHLADNYIRTE